MSKLIKGCMAAFVVLAIASVAQAIPPPPTSVPEIDPSMAAGALTLLVGGVLVLAGRGGRKK